jgi:hypothetical protein
MVKVFIIGQLLLDLLFLAGLFVCYTVLKEIKTSYENLIELLTKKKEGDSCGS